MRLMKKPIVASGKIWFQPPNKFRREVKGNSPSITVSDGLNLENIENTFQINATKSDKGYDLTLLPRTASMKRVFQKLDLHIKENLGVERTDMLLPSGDRIVTSYSNQTRAPIPGSTFEFKPPAGTEVTTPLGQ